MKKLILLISILLIVGCDDDGNNSSSYSVIGGWERQYDPTHLFEIIFNEDGTLTANIIDSEDGTSVMPEHTYTTDNNIITLIGSCNPEDPSWPQNGVGNYSYIINDVNTMLTLTVIDDECTAYDDDREGFFSDESSAVWTRVN